MIVSPATTILMLRAHNKALEYGVRSQKHLQQWIHDMHRDNIAASSIRTYIAAWCADHHIKVPRLDYPRTLTEPTTIPTITQVRDVARQDEKIRSHLTFLLSSGCRIGELTKLKTENITSIKSLYRIHVPATITKTGKGRITYSHVNLPESVMTITQFGKRWLRARRAAGHNDMCKVGKQNRYTLHPHSLRALFISALPPGLGHHMAGHSLPLDTYHIYTEQDMIDAHIAAGDKIRL